MILITSRFNRKVIYNFNLSLVELYFFFFFQAEDGIRDIGVTGVQTCALPISADRALVDHLVATTGLTPAEAARVVEDVVAFHAEPVEEYVRRRHTELKTFEIGRASCRERV